MRGRCTQRRHCARSPLVAVPGSFSHSETVRDSWPVGWASAAPAGSASASARQAASFLAIDMGFSGCGGAGILRKKRGGTGKKERSKSTRNDAVAIGYRWQGKVRLAARHIRRQVNPSGLRLILWQGELLHKVICVEIGEEGRNAKFAANWKGGARVSDGKGQECPRSSENGYNRGAK